MKRPESVSTNTHRRQVSHTICFIQNLPFTTVADFVRSTTRRYTMFWNAPVSKRKSSIQSTRPMNGSSPIWKQSSVPLRLSRKAGALFHQRKLPVNIPRLYSGRNSRKPSTRPRSSLRKVTRCSGTQRCVSERHFLPYRLSRTWSFSVL